MCFHSYFIRNNQYFTHELVLGFSSVAGRRNHGEKLEQIRLSHWLTQVGLWKLEQIQPSDWLSVLIQPSDWLSVLSVGTNWNKSCAVIGRAGLHRGRAKEGDNGVKAWRGTMKTKTGLGRKATSAAPTDQNMSCHRSLKRCSPCPSGVSTPAWVGSVS